MAFASKIAYTDRINRSDIPENTILSPPLALFSSPYLYL